jgi:hypothetical protein
MLRYCFVMLINLTLYNDFFFFFFGHVHTYNDIDRSDKLPLTICHLFFIFFRDEK